jgi:hypothetical protein
LRARRQRQFEIDPRPATVVNGQVADHWREAWKLGS